jgi:hypothetical protein
MAEHSFGFNVKCVMMRNALRVFGSNGPSKRELVIQIEKLEKLAKKFEKKFTAALVLSTPREKYRQKEASDLHRLTLQAKHVDELFARMIEEVLQANYPNEIPVKRKAFTARARKFTAQYNRLIQADAKKMMAEAKTSALAEFSRSELSSGKG